MGVKPPRHSQATRPQRKPRRSPRPARHPACLGVPMLVTCAPPSSPWISKRVPWPPWELPVPVPRTAEVALAPRPRWFLPEAAPRSRRRRRSAPADPESPAVPTRRSAPAAHRPPGSAWCCSSPRPTDSARCPRAASALGRCPAPDGTMAATPAPLRCSPPPAHARGRPFP